MEDGAKPYEEKGEGSDSGAASEPSQWSDEPSRDGSEDVRASVEALPADPVDAVAGTEEVEDTVPTISSESAELVTKSTMLMDTYAAVAAELQRVGAIALAANVIKEQRKEARRMRQISQVNTGVQIALTHDRDAKAAEERRRLRLLAELRGNRQSLSATKANLQEASEILRGKKRALFETELALEAKRAVKAFSLYELGEGRTRSGGAEGKRNRGQVLDRLVRLGQGISAAQRNDYAWFKDAWDGNMLAEHGDEWPAVFAGWAQRLVQAHEGGDRTAVSKFMRDEAQRCFAGEVALTVP